MKILLNFDFPEDEFDFRVAVDGKEYYFLIKDLLHEIRNKLKYIDLTDEQEKTYKSIEEFIHTDATGRNINLDIG